MLAGRQGRLIGSLRILIIAVLLFIFITLTARSRFSLDLIDHLSLKRPHSQYAQDFLETESFDPKMFRFWTDFERSLQLAGPECGPVKHDKNAEEHEFEPAALEDMIRPDLIDFSDHELAAMKESHEYAVESARIHADSLYYQPKTRGIVTTAGGSYLPVLLVSLRMLRYSGSNLPVDVFLADWSEFDWQTCEKILPLLNARCRVLSDILSTTPGLDSIQHYQFKVFALLFSSFEEVLFLDADAFPVHDPEQIFDSEPFRSTGYITWPDFWASSASQFAYEIAGVETPALSARASTESGEIAISKAMHTPTLLLATYYNYYGPQYYYPLLSQGGPGEGDKETFLHAALALNASFYDVKTPVEALGAHRNGTWMGAGMMQRDPTEDYEIFQRREQRDSRPENVVEAISAQTKANAEEEEDSTPEPAWPDLQKPEQEAKRQDKKPAERKARPFFVHNNNQKLNPKFVVNESRPIVKPNGEGYWRLWMDKKATIHTFGFDLERNLWEAIIVTGCAMEVATCEKLKGYWRDVFVKEDVDEEAKAKTEARENVNTG